jgi:hypothetical protein
LNVELLRDVASRELFVGVVAEELTHLLGERAGARRVGGQGDGVHAMAFRMGVAPASKRMRDEWVPEPAFQHAPQHHLVGEIDTPPAGVTRRSQRPHS